MGSNAASLSDLRRSLLVINGVGLLISAVASGWLYFFFTLGAIDLWPFVQDIPADIPGDRRAWNMAHLGIAANNLQNPLDHPWTRRGPPGSWGRPMQKFFRFCKHFAKISKTSIIKT